MCNRVKEHVYTVFFAFAGIGGGAIGFQQASATLAKHGLKGRFRVIGAFDFDAGAAADFELLTGVKCEVVDVRAMTPASLRALCPRRPDVVFGSAPCKGASPLLSNTLAETEKYQEMNELMLVWTRLMLAAWGEYTDEAGVRHASDLPLLIINENVPRLANRAKDVVAEVVKLLHGAGYATHAGSHNCGEVGGLAQNRVRFLLVARRHDRVPALVYQPKKQRVRGCGEVIGPLPLPSDPAGGAMHRLPDICATNCIRLALIPPGGDWRDIDGALKAHEKRREHWSRYHVARFDLTTPTVVGSGTNGAYGVADARVEAEVRKVAHNPDAHRNKYTVAGWGLWVGTIIGASHVGSGAPSIDDLRVPVAYGHAYGVTTWATPFGVITGHIGPSGGAFALLDVRLTCDVRENSGAYGVLDPARPAYTITAWGDINNGRFAYADARPQAPHAARRDVVALVVGMLAPEPADYTHDAADLPAPTPAPTKARRRKVRRVAAPGARARRRGGRHALLDVLTFAADPRVPGNPELALRFPVTRLDQPPLFVPVLPTASGCWHRPLTIWERFALQSFPLYDAAGRAIVLSGNDVTAWSERVGNAVPPLTAKAVGEEFLRTLLSAEAGVFELSSGGGAWVRGKPAPEWMRVLGVLDLYPRVDERACGSLAAIEHGDPWASWTREKGVSQAGGLLQ